MPNVITNFYVSAQMLLDDAKNYTFMTAGGLRVPGIDDVEEFTSTQNSMKVMGISDEDMTSIWRVISSCLLFGNMEFKQERSNDQVTTQFSSLLCNLARNRVFLQVHTIQIGVGCS